MELQECQGHIQPVSQQGNSDLGETHVILKLKRGIRLKLVGKGTMGIKRNSDWCSKQIQTKGGYMIF